MTVDSSMGVRGIFPIAETLDHVGPLCRTALDCAPVLDAIAGEGPLDAVSIRVDAACYSQASSAQTTALRLGMPRGFFYDDLDVEIAAAVEEALTQLTRLTAWCQDVTWPPTPHSAHFLAEGYASHAQYLADPDNHAHYHPVTLERLEAASGFPASACIAARRDLSLCRNAIANDFEQVDLLINAAPFNLYGIPTISTPRGFTRAVYQHLAALSEVARFRCDSVSALSRSADAIADGRSPATSPSLTAPRNRHAESRPKTKGRTPV